MNEPRLSPSIKVPVPPRIARLPLDPRGFPVPWFVQWFKDGRAGEPGEGLPDFRVVDTRKLARAVHHGRCWICGDPLGTVRAFVVGPMCVVNRISSEPPSHRDCAEFSALACPFLSRPKMRRNMRDEALGIIGAPGHHDAGNPGASAVYLTRGYQVTNAQLGARGSLFQMGDPLGVDWFANGRKATADEAHEAFEIGVAKLRALSRLDGDGTELDLARRVIEARKLLP